MSNRDIYLSDNNIDFLYRDVCDQVSRKYNYDLNSSTKYKNSFRGMMEKVYQNSDSNISDNLASLNRLTTQKIASYFFDQLSKKKSTNNNLMDRPMKASSNTSEKEINARLDMLRNQRIDTTPKKNIPPVGLSTIPIQDLESEKGETNKKYQELLAARKDVVPNSTNVVSDYAPINQSQPQQQTRNVTLNIQPSVANNNNKDEFNILPFTISDDFSDQTNNPGQPLYVNIDQLNEASGEKVNFKYEDLQKKRNMEIQEFLTFQQATENNTVIHNPQEIREGFISNSTTNAKGGNGNNTVNEHFTSEVNKVVSDYLGERTGVDHINAMRNPVTGRVEY